MRAATHFTERARGERVSAGQIRRDHVRAAIKGVFDGGGRSVPEIEGARGRRMAGSPEQAHMRGERVWHTRAELLDPVARALRLDPALWGRKRKSSDFYNAVDQEIAKLRRKGLLADWRGGSGVFRLAGALPEGWADAGPAARAAEPETDMGRAFMGILRRGAKANTYKFALARAILDHCRESRRHAPGSAEAREIPYGYLAGKFLRYYWHQECKFRIRQGFRTDSNPRVIDAIREVFGRGSPGDFGRLDRADVERARSRILKDVFGHARNKTSLVVPRFQNARAGGAAHAGIFYEHDDDEQKIRLRPEAVSFFRENDGILSGAVLAEWAKFLEKINSSLPMLVSKIERAESRRRSLAWYRKNYAGHARHCFYCSCRLERGRIDVDHVIPWSYMFEDDPWNLVLACSGCNRKKSDSLPEKEFLDTLIGRNLAHRDSIPRLRRSLDLLDSGRGWQPEIRGHYDSCEEYGFGVQALP